MKVFGFAEFLGTQKAILYQLSGLLLLCYIYVIDHSLPPFLNACHKEYNGS